MNFTYDDVGKIIDRSPLNPGMTVSNRDEDIAPAPDCNAAVAPPAGPRAAHGAHGIPPEAAHCPDSTPSRGWTHQGVAPKFYVEPVLHHNLKELTMSKLTAALASALLFIAASLCSAQSVASSITGTLADPTGAAVAGVGVQLERIESGANQSVKTDSLGLFRFPDIQPGTYQLKIQASGFKTYQQKGIQLAGSEVRNLGEIRLEIGSMTDSISVQAEATPVQTASSEKSSLLTGTQLEQVTVKGRDFFGLMMTLPGVVDDGSQSRDTADPNAIAGIYINGGRSKAKNFTVDGISNVDTGSNATVHYEPNMDSVAEVRLLSSNYQAEYGRSGAGLISVVTKAGTQTFHGTGWWSHRHEQFNANDFFNNRAGVSRAPYRFNIAGFSLGGPVYIPGKFNQDKRKLFIFVSQEYTRQRVNLATRYANMPTARERAGDFSQSLDTGGKLIATKDPLTGQAFPGNVIPASRINSVGQSILKFFPLPNYTDPDPRQVYNRNYAATGTAQHPRRNDVIRSDYYATSRLNTYFRYIHDADSLTTPAGNNNYTGFYGPTVDHPNPGHGYAAHATFTAAPTLIFDFTFGKSYNTWAWRLTDTAPVDRAQLGNAPKLYPFDTSLGNQEKLLPNVTFGGAPVNPPSLLMHNLPYDNANDIWSTSNSVTKVFGRHNIKAGIYIERTRKVQSSISRYVGAYNFARDANNPNDAGNAYANAILGNFSNYQETTGRPVAHLWFSDIEWYVQDNWRVSSRLTLDYGLRFYHVTPPSDSNHTLAGFDPQSYAIKNAPALYRPGFDSTGKRVAVSPLNGATAPAAMIGLYVPGSGDPGNGMRVGGVNGYPDGVYEGQSLTFGPRFGFAYDVTGNGKTAIRGGIGLFHDTPQGGPALGMAGNPPVTYSPTLYYGNIATLQQTQGLLGPGGLSFQYGKQKYASTASYSLGVQRSLFGGVVLDASYVGNFSRHLSWGRNINPIPMFARFNPANADPTNTKVPLPDNFLRPYSGWGALNIREFAGTANYNSVQLSVNRRFSQGLVLGVAYTFSKALGAADADDSAVSPYFSPRSRNYGRLSFDRTQILSLNYLYELPALRGRNRFLQAAAGRWTLSGVAMFSSGAPFTPSLGTTAATDITGSDESARITLVGDPNLPGGQRTFYRNFNASAFALTPAGSFGNAGVNILTGPGACNWDIAVGKKIPLGLGEGRVLHFRTEFYNALNHTQFSAVDAAARFDASGAQTNSNFGSFSAARRPRIISFALRLAF